MSKAERNRQRAREKIAQARAAEARRKQPPRWLAEHRRRGRGRGGGRHRHHARRSAAAAPSHRAPAHRSCNLAPLSTLGSLKTAPPPARPAPRASRSPAASPLATTSTKATGRQDRRNQLPDQRADDLPYPRAPDRLRQRRARQIPAGIGIPGAKAQNTAQGQFIASGNCFYWLHTHAADGIIHIESPIHRIYTLGDFFDEWGQPLGPAQVGPVTRPRHRDLQRPGLPGQPPRHPPQRPRPDPAGGRHPAGRPDLNNLAQRPVAFPVRRRPRHPHPGESGSRSTTRPRTTPQRRSTDRSDPAPTEATAPASPELSPGPAAPTRQTRHRRKRDRPGSTDPLDLAPTESSSDGQPRNSPLAPQHRPVRPGTEGNTAQQLDSPPPAPPTR